MAVLEQVVQNPLCTTGRVALNKKHHCERCKRPITKRCLENKHMSFCKKHPDQNMKRGLDECATCQAEREAYERRAKQEKAQQDEKDRLKKEADEKKAASKRERKPRHEKKAQGS